MKLGGQITIMPSDELLSMKLGDLVGRTAVVVEVATNQTGEPRGCWVALDGEPFIDEQEWYIPTCSIV